MIPRVRKRTEAIIFWTLVACALVCTGGMFFISNGGQA